jgi:hypothetical protein
LNNLIWLFNDVLKQCGLDLTILCFYNYLCYLALGFYNFGLWRQQIFMTFCTF